MDIMEGSKDLTELLDNDVVQDVVDQTRGLVEQVIKKVCVCVCVCMWFGGGVYCFRAGFGEKFVVSLALRRLPCSRDGPSGK